MKSLRILHLEDDAADALLIQELILAAGIQCHVTRVQSEVELRSALLQGKFDLILADYSLPGYDGASALRLSRDWRPDIPFIFVSGTLGEDAAIESLTHGATDYVLKQKLSRLVPAIERALSEADRRREQRRAEDVRHRLNRELRAISTCHQALLRASEERTLFETVCKIICQEVGYRCAWVSSVSQDATQCLRFATGYQRDAENSSSQLPLWSEGQLGQLFPSSTIGAGDIVCVQDLEQSTALMPMRESALRLGIHSAVALPLKDEFKGAFAILCIVSEERNVFTDDEVRLLDELANDLAFGVVALRNRQERMHAEEELRRVESKRQQLERELYQAQKIESLGTLASGIAHDFNNILAIILGYTDLLVDLTQSKEEREDSIRAIQTATSRGTTLVKQLLTFARKTDTQLVPVSLNNVVVELAALLRGTFPKTVEIATILDDSIGSIAGDVTQIHQVLLNLCVNARDAMPNGGRLSITTKAVDADTALSDSPLAAATEYVLVSVSDSGTGIDDETRQRMFEPFFTTKEHGKGTGLGLALVHSIVDSHHGLIAVDSRLGLGTTFRIYFPRELAIHDARIPSTEQPRESGRGQATVLLVEDEELLARLAKTWLVAQGYQVLTARDGEEAVSAFTRFQREIGVVVSDFGLPKCSGDEVFRRIRELAPDAKFILASGYLEPAIKARMVDDGVSQFLQKPYQSRELLAAVQDAIHQASAT